MTIDDIIERLQKACTKAGDQRSWAAEHNISGVLKRRKPGDKILNALGLERVTTYRYLKPIGDRAQTQSAAALN
jgi:hypothetical protein